MGGQKFLETLNVEAAAPKLMLLRDSVSGLNLTEDGELDSFRVFGIDLDLQTLISISANHCIISITLKKTTRLPRNKHTLQSKADKIVRFVVDNIVEHMHERRKDNLRIDFFPFGNGIFGNVSMPPASTPSKTRGRKPKETATEKDKRNLENQRAFRQRKQALVDTLQLENEALKAQLAGTVPASKEAERILALEAELSLMRSCGVAVDLKASFGINTTASTDECRVCSVEKIKTLVCFGRLHELEVECRKLKEENDALKTENLALKSAPSSSSSVDPFSSLFGISPTTSNQNTMDWMDTLSPTIPAASITAAIQSIPPGTSVVSAAQLFGPLNTQSTRTALKAIPSLANSSKVDKLMDLYERAMESTDRNEIKRFNVKLMGLRGKLLDECGSVIDRQKAVELIVLHLRRNNQHIQYRNSMFVDVDTPNASTPSSSGGGGGGRSSSIQLPEQGIVLRDAFLSIPSIKNSPEGDELVNELCALFPWGNNKPTNGEEILVQMLTIGKKLEKLCDADLEDRTKFSLVTETFRAGNKLIFKELYKYLEGSSSEDEE
ncbi:UNVERIFIED_CONTAM: hypothetical protein HDU68_004433 [Siphonaria sp. JEL0065]|nr:hypothetical protein HDU68_004433 [Siphonaria sp. JEL0065]